MITPIDEKDLKFGDLLLFKGWIVAITEVNNVFVGAVSLDSANFLKNVTIRRVNDAKTYQRLGTLAQLPEIFEENAVLRRKVKYLRGLADNLGAELNSQIDNVINLSLIVDNDGVEDGNSN